MQHGLLSAINLSRPHKSGADQLIDAKKASLRTNFDAFQSAWQPLKCRKSDVRDGG
jgi:hypothetical protein